MPEFNKNTTELLNTVIADTQLAEPWSVMAAEGSDEARAPITNRGVENTNKGIEFKCDWFSVTIHESFDHVFTKLVPLLISGSPIADYHWSDLFHDLGHGGRGYKKLWVSPIGVTLYAEPINKDQTHCHIEIKGKALDTIGQGRLIGFAKTIDREFEKWNVTRFDGAYDHSDITPHMLKAAYEDRQIRTHCRTTKWIESQAPNGVVSSTWYLGNRGEGTERLMRCYDVRGYNRIELELRKTRADMVFKDLLKTDLTLWPKRFMEHVRDFVDVIDADTGSGNRSRADLIGWWADFVKDAEKAGMRLETKDPSLDRSKEWVEHSVVTTLGMLLDSGKVDQDWLFREIERGRKKMSRRQQLLSDTFKISNPPPENFEYSDAARFAAHSKHLDSLTRGLV
jgi:hypothetical protein